MTEKLDTLPIHFDEPISDAYVNLSDISDEELATTESCIEGEGSSPVGSDGQDHIQRHFTPVPQKQKTFGEWLVNKTGDLSRQLIVATMRANIDITKLSSSRQHTIPIDASAIVSMLQREEIIVSVSPELYMSREEVHASSLLVPSGFLLTWLERFGDELNGE